MNDFYKIAWGVGGGYCKYKGIETVVCHDPRAFGSEHPFENEEIRQVQPEGIWPIKLIEDRVGLKKPNFLIKETWRQPCFFKDLCFFKE